jgi:hypothetical protein
VLHDGGGKKEVGVVDISPVFTDFSPKNNEKKQAQCLQIKVSSEPSKLRKK